MTIDERLEALTQSLELLSTLHRDNEKRTEQRMDQILEAMARNEKRMAGNEKRMEQIMDAITRLARMAGAHQDRLDDHGDRIERLEGGPPGAPEDGPRGS